MAFEDIRLHVRLKLFALWNPSNDVPTFYADLLKHDSQHKQSAGMRSGIFTNTNRCARFV